MPAWSGQLPWLRVAKESAPGLVEQLAPTILRHVARTVNHDTPFRSPM
jgi:hypothetical protein